MDGPPLEVHERARPEAVVRVERDASQRLELPLIYDRHG